MFLFLLLQMLWPTPAMATSAVYLSDLEQAERSTAVVVVTIGAARSGVDARTDMPTTHTTVRVEETLRGEAPATVEIEQFGGTRDGRTLRVPGDALLVEGTRAVLFLRHVDGGWFLTALGQSHYGLQADGTLTRNHQLALWVRDAEGRLVPSDGGPATNTLDRLRAAVGR